MKTSNPSNYQIISFLTTILITISINLYSQSSPNNLDFEDGTLNNWIAYTGGMFTIDSIAELGVVNGRHTITSGLVTDPNTDNQIYTVAPGSNYSCRLGNDAVGAQAERLEYTYRVSDTSALFIYQYAVVFQDPGHYPAEQPQFEVSVLDSIGNCIDWTCAYYQVTAAGEIPGFNSYLNTRYKDWTTVGLDLTNYIGDLITISFTTKDCGQGGHFGYAYIDASYQPMELLVKACADSDSIILSAPYGFEEYLWMPGNITAREFKIPTEQAGDEFECTLTSVTGCRVTLNATTELTFIEPDFELESCKITQFNNLSTIQNGVIASWEWNFNEPENNNSSTLQNPEYYFHKPGIHNVSLTVTSIRGCKATITKPAKIYFKPQVDFTFDEVCYGHITSFTNISRVEFTDTIKYYWDFGDGSISNKINPEYVFNTPNNNIVKLKVQIGDNCFQIKTKEVNTQQCQVMMPNVISPSMDSSNEMFFIKNLDNYPINNFVVFNRWGIKIYETDNYTNNWSPQRIVSGTYYYIFTYLYDSPEINSKTLTGFFEVFADN